MDNILIFTFGRVYILHIYIQKIEFALLIAKWQLALSSYKWRSFDESNTPFTQATTRKKSPLTSRVK